MIDKENEARRHARVMTGCQGDFDQGWEAGAAWAQAEIAKRMEFHAEKLITEYKGSALLAMAQAQDIRDGTWKR